VLRSPATHLGSRDAACLPAREPEAGTAPLLVADLRRVAAISEASRGQKLNQRLKQPCWKQALLLQQAVMLGLRRPSMGLSFKLPAFCSWV
jgi:hypothetical protein